MGDQKGKRAVQKACLRTADLQRKSAKDENSFKGLGLCGTSRVNSCPGGNRNLLRVMRRLPRDTYTFVEGTKIENLLVSSVVSNRIIMGMTYFRRYQKARDK